MVLRTDARDLLLVKDGRPRMAMGIISCTGCWLAAFSMANANVVTLRSVPRRIFSVSVRRTSLLDPRCQRTCTCWPPKHWSSCAWLQQFPGTAIWMGVWSTSTLTPILRAAQKIMENIEKNLWAKCEKYMKTS